MTKNSSSCKADSAANVGREVHLWHVADALRGIDSGQIAPNEH